MSKKKFLLERKVVEAGGVGTPRFDTRLTQLIFPQFALHMRLIRGLKRLRQKQRVDIDMLAPI